jgi:hypothetical protein
MVNFGKQCISSYNSNLTFSSTDVSIFHGSKFSLSICLSKLLNWLFGREQVDDDIDDEVAVAVSTVESLLVNDLLG